VVTAVTAVTNHRGYTASL